MSVRTPSRNGFSAAYSRPALETTRTDQLQPYGDARRREGAGGVTKSHYMENGLFRWIQQLGGDSDLSRPYAQHPWIYACVAAIGRAASSVPIRLQRELPNGTFETVTKTPLSNVFGYPNPLQSQRKFFRSVCTSQQLYGETFLILLKKGDGGALVPVDAVGGTRGMMATIEPPDEIWPVRGDLVEVDLDDVTKLPALWKFNSGGSVVVYPAHAIVQVAEVNPYNPLRGMGPMQAAYRTAAKDFVIDRYDEALLQNGGSPGGVLSVDGPLTDGDQRAIREAWQEAQGRPESHRKTAVLPKGTTYKEIGMSPQQMEHESLRDWDRQTILSIFGVPPVILGLETINYATAKEQNRIFWDTTIIPYLDFLKDELQHKLVGRLRGPDSQLVVDFDISGVAALREDMDSKVDRCLKLYEKGHRSFEEAAHLAGWDITEYELEGSDERWVLSNMIPAGAGVSLADAQRQMDPPEGAEEARLAASDSVDLEVEQRENGNEAVVDTLWPPHLQTEEKRVGYWRFYTEQEDKVIAKVSKRTVRVYRDLLLYVRKRLREVARSSSSAGAPAGVTKWVPTEAELDRLLEINRLEWSELLAAQITPVLQESMVRAALGLAGELSVQPIISSITDPFIIETFKGYPVYLAEGPTSTLAFDIRKSILRVFADSDVSAAPSLRDAIRRTLAEQERGITKLIDNLDARANRIARTETLKANNGTRLEEMKGQEVEEHVWLSSRDAAVRVEHQRMDGEVVRVGDEFSNGVRFPGDRAGSGRQVVNCRCVTNAVTKPETNQ